MYDIFLLHTSIYIMEGGYDFPFDEAVVKELMQSYTHEKMSNNLKNDVVDRAMGCLFGSFIGDALGAYLEFAKQKDYDNMMKDVMEMPGGGVFKVKSGQITDDSEMAFHLLKALAGFDPQGQFDKNVDNLLITVANEYLKWFDSRPFDIGITCRKGLAEIATLFYQQQIDRNTEYFNLQPARAKQIATLIKESVQLVSKDSQSNGSLMRMAPLPFYFGLFNKPAQGDFLNKQIGITKFGMMDFIHKQTGLLHPNATVVEVCEVWHRTVLSLIKRKDNADIANIYKAAKKRLEDEKIGWGNFLSNPYPISAKKQHIGWSKIAITLGFETLKSITNHTDIQLTEQTYTKYIREVLSRGGDTDTNAAIVGGMLGALVGFKKLPKKYISKLMSVRFNPKQGGKRTERPLFYQPRVAFANAFTIIRKAMQQ